MRDSWINIRVTAKEKKFIKSLARSAGFHNLSAFIYWLIDQYSKKESK